MKPYKTVKPSKVINCRILFRRTLILLTQLQSTRTNLCAEAAQHVLHIDLGNPLCRWCFAAWSWFALGRKCLQLWIPLSTVDIANFAIAPFLPVWWNSILEVLYVNKSHSEHKTTAQQEQQHPTAKESEAKQKDRFTFESSKIMSFLIQLILATLPMNVTYISCLYFSHNFQPAIMVLLLSNSDVVLQEQFRFWCPGLCCHLWPNLYIHISNLKQQVFILSNFHCLKMEIILSNLRCLHVLN